MENYVALQTHMETCSYRMSWARARHAELPVVEKPREHQPKGTHQVENCLCSVAGASLCRGLFPIHSNDAHFGKMKRIGCQGNGYRANQLAPTLTRSNRKRNSSLKGKGSENALVPLKAYYLPIEELNIWNTGTGVWSWEWNEIKAPGQETT